MNLFKSIRPLVQIAVELRRIATVMEYFAIGDARANNRMFIPKKKGWKFNEKDESELLHTNDIEILKRQIDEELLFQHGGTKALEAEELSDLNE